MISKTNKKQRILVLEDDRITRMLLARILEQSGYEAIECSEGRDAIHLAEMHPPTAIIVDVMLPDMRGTEVVTELKRYPQCRDIPCIFLTGILKKKSDVSARAISFNIEGKEYPALPKPVSPDSLIPLLRKTVRSAALANQTAAKADAAEETASHGTASNSQRNGRDSGNNPAKRQAVIGNIARSPLWKS